jgi:CheY-like chemotaxis protein
MSTTAIRVMKKKKILVIEDDKRITTALAVRLEAEGYEVLTAVDGFDGLKLILTERPDLLLLDIWMPVGTGFSVVQRLKALGLDTIPKIFITASRLRGLRRAAMQLGGSGFFEKPYDPDVLLQAIAQALNPLPEQLEGEPAIASGSYAVPPPGA